MRYLEQVKKIDTRRGRMEIPLHERRGLWHSVLVGVKYGGCELISQNGFVITVI